MTTVGRPLRKQPRGQALVTMAVSMVVLLGFVGLAIDVGMLMVTRNEMQNAADAAALAGVAAVYKRNDGTYEPLPNFPRAADSATNAITYNKALKTALVDGTVTTGYWNIAGTPAGMQPTSKTPLVVNDAAAVRVTVKKSPGHNGGSVALFLAPLVGIRTEAIQATAVAVVSYPGSVSEGELYPTAMSGCLFNKYWDVATNSPKLDPSLTPPAPYEFKIGSSYHYEGCESGQWTSFNLGTQSASDMKGLIKNGNGGPLAIGDTIYVQDGTETSGYVESIKDGLIGQTILVPVTNSLEGGTWQTIVGFGAFKIDDIKGGSDKYIQGHFAAGLIVPIAGPGGPSWGALIPPTLVQ
jgi:Flp pilus assembly protein TadG